MINSTYGQDSYVLRMDSLFLLSYSLVDQPFHSRERLII